MLLAGRLCYHAGQKKFFRGETLSKREEKKTLNCCYVSKSVKILLPLSMVWTSVSHDSIHHHNSLISGEWIEFSCSGRRRGNCRPHYDVVPAFRHRLTYSDCKITIELSPCAVQMIRIETHHCGSISRWSRTSHECRNVSGSWKWSSQLYPLKCTNSIFFTYSGWNTFGTLTKSIEISDLN